MFYVSASRLSMFYVSLERLYTYGWGYVQWFHASPQLYIRLIQQPSDKPQSPA